MWSVYYWPVYIKPLTEAATTRKQSCNTISVSHRAVYIYICWYLVLPTATHTHTHRKFVDLYNWIYLDEPYFVEVTVLSAKRDIIMHFSQTRATLCDYVMQRSLTAVICCVTNAVSHITLVIIIIDLLWQQDSLKLLLTTFFVITHRTYSGRPTKQCVLNFWNFSQISIQLPYYLQGVSGCSV